jgi:hypothetical protein
MAVDFAAKRWRSSKDDSNLRLIKLRTTRKVLFAGPLCSILLVPDRIQLAKDLPQYLRNWFCKPPLAQLASLLSDDFVKDKLAAPTKDAVSRLLVNYDSLLEVFNERGARDDLKDSSRVGHKETRGKCEQLANDIEESLEVIFFDDPLFNPRVRKYCVF